MNWSLSRSSQREIRDLKRLLAEKVLEVDFFKGALAANQGSTAREQKVSRTGIYDLIRDVVSLRGSLGIERRCHLAAVSRAGFL
jgi:hypothetical protein